uniref:Uncharacterized protein n=1 Tax=Escherichia coli TaxID=562 RepID=A0A5S9GF71_ECOLX|nr:hypothetical protein [Escherichia coli]
MLRVTQTIFPAVNRIIPDKALCRYRHVPGSVIASSGLFLRN